MNPILLRKKKKERRGIKLNREKQNKSARATGERNKDYFLNRFPQQLGIFIKAVPDYLLFFPEHFSEGGKSFRFRFLIKGKTFDVLKEVPKEDHILFLIALAYIMLINQVIYTYFKQEYPEFNKRTNIPKMKVGGSNENPWTVFHINVLTSRDIKHHDLYDQFKDFTKFFVDYMPSYVGVVNDHALVSTMLNDKDVIRGTFGNLLGENLERWEEKRQRNQKNT